MYIDGPGLYINEDLATILIVHKIDSEHMIYEYYDDILNKWLFAFRDTKSIDLINSTWNYIKF